MKKLILIFLLCLTLQAEGTFETSGYGKLSCGKYLSLLEEHEAYREVFKQYLKGFETGVSFSSGEKNKLAKYNTESVEKWLKNYCEANPLDLYITGLVKLHKTDFER